MTRRLVLPLLLLGAACERERAPAERPAPDSAPPVAAAPCYEHRVLGDSGVGVLRIGAPFATVRERCTVIADETGPGPEGHPERRARVALGPDTVTAVVVADSVWRISVTSAGLRTADSLGVGTRLERLRREPGAVGLEGEGDLYVRVTSHCGLSFRLGATLSGRDLGRPADEVVRDLPAEVPVEEVLVIGCLGEVPSGASSGDPIAAAAPARPREALGRG